MRVLSEQVGATVSAENLIGKDFEAVLIRFLAVLLITNSHLDALYPDSRLATGGGLGNALFFTLSGFGLALSARKQLASFFYWYGTRLSRIYPQVLLLLITLGIIGGEIFSLSSSEIFRHLFWPTPYWFVAAIIVFYVPLYFVLRCQKLNVKWILIFSVAPYCWFYGTTLDLSHFSIESDYFRWLFYLPMMLFGVFLASNETLRERSRLDGLKLVAILGAYFGLKIVFAKGLVTELQFLIHVLTIPFVFYVFRFFSQPLLLDKCRNSGAFRWVSTIAGLSLEIYLIQIFLIRWLVTNHVPQTLALLVVVPGILLGAYLLARLTTVVTNAINLLTCGLRGLTLSRQGGRL